MCKKKERLVLYIWHNLGQCKYKEEEIEGYLARPGKQKQKSKKDKTFVLC